MDVLQAIILGAVQGLSEFLPISSSGHLVILHSIFKKDLGLSFDLVLHWGTLLAVLFYFKQDIVNLIRGFWHSLFKSTRDFSLNIYQKLPWLIILASLPAIIFGKLLESKIENFRSPVVVAINLAVFGFVMLLGEYFGKKEKSIEKITWQDALIFGLFQALAIIPGVSRSGATISAGLFLAFKRPDSAKFSFLMSVPVFFGAGILEIHNIQYAVSSIELISGFLASTLFGFIAIKYLLKYIGSNSFSIFVWYRFFLAALIFVIFFDKIF